MELLRTWLNDDLGLSRPVDSFEADFANGYLLGELLHRKGLLPSLDGLVDRDTSGAKVENFKILLQPLRDLKVKFDSNMATKIMAGEAAVATRSPPLRARHLEDKLYTRAEEELV